MTTRNYLSHRMNVLRDLVGSPHEAARYADERYHPNVGHVGWQYNRYYTVFEITGKGGSERNLAEGMSLPECIRFVDGAIMALEGNIRRHGNG